MVRLRDIKYLTKKKVVSLQPIYYVSAGIRCGNTVSKAKYIKLEGEELKNALETQYILYDDDKMFTTEEEAQELVDKFNEKKVR